MLVPVLRSNPTLLAFPLFRFDLELLRLPLVAPWLEVALRGSSTFDKLEDWSLRVPRELAGPCGVLQPLVPTLPAGLGFLTLLWFGGELENDCANVTRLPRENETASAAADRPLIRVSSGEVDNDAAADFEEDTS